MCCHPVVTAVSQRGLSAVYPRKLPGVARNTVLSSPWPIVRVAESRWRQVGESLKAEILCHPLPTWRVPSSQNDHLLFLVLIYIYILYCLEMQSCHQFGNGSCPLGQYTLDRWAALVQTGAWQDHRASHCPLAASKRRAASGHMWAPLFLAGGFERHAYQSVICPLGPTSWLS